MTDETSKQDEQNTGVGVKWREPTIGETTQFALTDNPFGETDREAAAKADMLGRVYFDLLQKANEPVDPKMDDDDARAEAVYFTKSMTGLDDVPGKLWRKGGFATGKEYLAYMRDFFRKSPHDNKTQELRDFEALDEAGQTAAALEAQKTTDWLKHLGGNAATALRDYVLRYEPNAVIDIEREEKEKKYQAEVRSAYHAKLLADNAWIELSGILPRLSEDGRACTKALMDSPDNKLPTEYYAKFNNLPDEEKQMLIRARTVLAPKVEGNFANWLGDMGVGLANISASLAAAPVRFGNKLAVKFNIGGAGDIFDVNEISRRRQYLWQATGDFAVGGEDGFVPQLQFEQICEDHGFVAESLIGAVTTLPYMAAAAVPGVGIAEVALEAMSEMDDHVAMNGGDITDGDYMLTSAILGAMYAYTERLQIEGWLGKVSDIKMREAWLKGVWGGIANKMTLRNMSVGTFSESLQEGVQNGIMSVNEALALDGDAVRAFGEGFTEDFVGSLGTMFVIEASGIVGGHVKRSGFRWGAEGQKNRSTDLEKEYGKLLCQRQMVDYEGQSVGLRTAMQSAIEGRLYNEWKDGGKDALVKAGVDPVQAEEYDYYFQSERDRLAQEEETGEAVPMDWRSVNAQRSLDAYLAKEAKKLFNSGRNTDADMAAFDLAMQNLDWVRSAWAQGRGIFRQDGDKTLDPGAKALEKLGFTPDVAARLSRQFHYERAAAYSPAALAGIKSRYEERMKDKVTAVAALAEMFGGRKVRIENADYIQFDGKDGTRNLVRIDESPAAGIDFANADEGIAVDVERATEGKVTKADWMAATEEERRKIWNDYGLVHEGSFGANRAPILVTVSADPSAKVDQNQAAKLIGTISIDATTDPNRISDTSSGFHEVFHAFSYFAQASGLWTDEDIAYLEKTFGKAKHSQERFDEEAAAEAFRSFLARRAAGAMTADDERSPFVRIYAAAAGIDQRSAEKAVQEKMANESENAFFHQLIAEANKPKPPAPEPKPTLSKSAAPQKGIAPVKENVAPAKQNGPEVKQNAAPVNADAPKTWSAYTPTGNVKVSGHWAVFDLKDVIHSNNPLYAVHMRAQLRNRKDNKAEEDTRKDIVNNFQGERLLEAPDTANGAPIVFLDRDENGTVHPFVLSGNGRVLVLNELADRHLYDRYRNVMKKWAAENGIFVPGGQTPILVRVIDDYGGASRDKVADLSNTNSIQQYTEEEQARADAEVIKSLNIARLYVANADGSADMTPGVNDEFFSEFIRGVGDTSLYNSDRSLTQTARDRAQRALLAIAVGQGDRGRDVVKKLVEQTETLGIQRQKNAAAIIAADVAALETNAAYAIGPDVSRAMADFMDYAEKKKAGKVGNFAEYYAQMDLIDAPSPVARAILQLFGSDKSAATIAEYVRAYCTAASMEDPSGGLFGAARTREEIWNDAAKFVDEELKKAGQTKTEPAPKAVETKPAPAKEEPKAKPSGLSKGDVSITPEPETPKPKLATTGYTITTAKGETITAQLPPGGHTGLRGPYNAYEDVPESPNPIRSIFSGKVTIQKDPQGRYWGDKMPQFMGHKTEMFDRTVQTLREKMSPQELANYDTVVDYFGGGGCWGMSLALATMPNVKRIIINEFDPARASKIELLQTIGEKIADEAEKMLMDDGVLDEIAAKMKTKGDDGGESGSGATLANLILREYKSRYAGDKRKLGLLYAITDCASRQLAGSRDVRQPDGTTAKVKISFVERWKKVKEQLANDGKNASEMRKEIEKRGGTVEYVNGNSTLDDFGTGFKTPHGGNVMAVCDPPYYRTEGYSDDGSSWKVGLEKTSGGYAYADTAELLQRLVDKGDGIVYTDEAWWLKPEYLTTHNVESDGLFDNADLISSQREYRTEHGILQGIRNTLDHFDVAGRVAGRYETLGVHHGNDEKARTGASGNTATGAELGSKPDGSGSADNGRHSVRRLAGGAEGEDSTLLRNGRGSGQRSEDVVREVNAAIIDALPDGTYGFPGQLATLERIIRHSVRSLREDKQTAYAKTVAKNAKAYLARTAKQLDARMKAAGYTEKVWHGTGSGQFQVFRLATREDGTNSIGGFADDGIKMAFFSYYEQTAQNYAALSSFDVDTDYETLREGAKPDVREYYVNPGKCLELDEAKWPQDYQKWTKTLHKAWKDGYDSIKLINALDDQGVKLIEEADGTERMEWAEEDELGPKGTPIDENSASYRTDILVVFDHGEKNPGANRIKAADPITFWDEEHGELPIPPEMRANKDIPDLRFSIQAMGKNAKEEARKAIEKYRPDYGIERWNNGPYSTTFLQDTLQKYEKKTGSSPYKYGAYTDEFLDFAGRQFTDEIIDEIEKFSSVKERKAALYWFCKATVRLPEDAPKITEALKTAERAKVDPFQYERPGDILEQFAEYRPKEKPIDPDKVPELSDKREMGHGIVTYLVQDDKAGQAAMRKIINTHFGKDASPWCLLQGDKGGNLTSDAWHYWQHYNALPKRVAFKDGKLVAFMATDRSVLGDRDEAEIRYEEAIEDGDEIPDKEAWILKQIGGTEQWWDRTDAPHDGIPFTEKDGDRTLHQELSADGNVTTTLITRGDPRMENETYEEWNPSATFGDRDAHKITVRKNGITIRKASFYGNGQMSYEIVYPNKDSAFIEKSFLIDGMMTRLTANNFKPGEASGSIMCEFGMDNQPIAFETNNGVINEEIHQSQVKGGVVQFAHSNANTGINYTITFGADGFGTTAEGTRMYLPPITREMIEEKAQQIIRGGIVAPFSSLMKLAKDIPDLRHSVTAAGRYYGTRMRELAHGIKTGEKNAIAESARILADYVHDNAVLVPMPSHTGKATTMKTLAEAIAKIRPDVEVVDALKSDPHESNYTHKQRLHKPVAVTMHPTGAKIPDGRPVMVLDNVLASGTTARAALAVIPDADILVLGDASRAADPNEKLSPENEKLRHSIIIGALKSKSRKDPDRAVRLADALDMYDAADGYDKKTREEIYVQTGWWMGVDGKWRVEIPNVKPKPKFGKTIAHPESMGGGYSMINGLSTLIWKDGKERMYAPLKDMATAPALFDAYPQLKYVDVVILDPYSDEMEGVNGYYDGHAIGISWDCVQWRNDEPSNILNEQGVQTLTHEIQHIVQATEGFAYGGNMEDYGKRNYALLAGEVEARNASRRNTNYKMYGGFARLASMSADPDLRTWAVNNGNAPWQTEDVPQAKQIITYGDGKMTDINGKPVARHSVYRDVETDARRAISAIAQDGDKKEAEDALENYVAYFKLAHGPLPRPRTIARIGLSLGMNVVDPKRILKNADKLAERMRGTAIEKAAGNGDVGTAIAMMKREKDLDRKFESILAGGVSLGSQLTHKGVGQINALTQRRVERMMNDFTAATLADMEGDTGINLAAEILENNPDAFETEYRKAKKLTEEQEAETADQQQEGSAQGAAPDEIDEDEMSDADRYKRQVLLKEAAERVAKFIEDAKARAKDNTAKAEERRKQRRVVELGGDTNEEGGAEAEGSSSGNGKFNPKPEDVKAGFKTPEEFAAFLRVWTADKFAKTHGLTTIGQAQQNKLFAEYYRICARQELQDLADKLLAPKMLNAAGELVTNARVAKLGNGARAWVNRRLQEMEKGIKPDRIERMSADIFAFINKAAVRVSRVDLIANFKKDLKERFLHDPDFDEFKQDTERKVTGWVEEATRYICRVCDLSKISVNGDPSQLEQEYRRLHEIIDRRAQVYDESGREVAAAAQEDAETLKAQWMLALLDKYGAMRSMMPGEILDLQNAAFQYLEDEAAKLEQAWKDTRAQQDQIRRDFTAAIVGPNGQKYQAKGIFSGRLFDALNGMIRLRLQHLTRFASPDEQAKAKDAINSLLVMLGDGETAYAKALQEDREAFFSGLGQIFQKPDGTADNAAIKKYIERMDEPIPQELSEKVSNQGYVGTMTHGQLLQLLVSLEQRSFKDAIKANGREGQAELIRNFRYLKEDGTAENVVTAEDSRFIEMLRAFYAAKRDQLSAVTERMVGHKVDSPDPLYCPVRRWIDDKARSLHTDPSQRWDPISKIFSRRVESDRDFDESRTIIGLFFENSKESAKLTAWAERGSFIRNIVTSVGFQASVKRAFGNGELGKILKQLEATFNGGEVRSQTPGEVAAADKAVNFVTYAYLGFNPLSALKQTTSPFVWANVLDGGFADLWRHMTHFNKNVLKHLMESDEYKVRYGNKVGSGMDYATKGLNMNPSENPAVRFLTGAGMWMLKRGDFIPGGWIAQGVYKDMLNKHMNEGMDYEAADRLAITETFNLLEETQQSGRTYNTNMLQIEHGRIGRLLTQFATSPLQQLQYETQAWREWRDMVRYQMDEKKIATARQRFWRAAVINHVLMPAAMNFVIAAYKAAMGEEPPWEKDGYHWSLLIDVLMGQFSRVFFLGAFAQTTLNAVFKRETPRAGQILPIEGALGMVTTIGFTVHDMATLNYDNIQKDLERMLKSTAPTRIPFNLYRRITGDSDADRKAKKKAK